MDSTFKVSSIHRLDRDVWAQIANLLVENDLIRLIMAGSPPLARLVKAGSKRLSLRWNVIDYLDLYRIFNAHREIRCEQLIIRSLFAEQLVWKSSSTVIMWPSMLTKLELYFNGAIELVLEHSPLKALWPSLTVLKLIEEVKDGRLMTLEPLSLCDLPVDLSELHLASSRQMYCVESDLSELPARLRVLTLDVTVRPWIPTEALTPSAPRLGSVSEHLIIVDHNLPAGLEELTIFQTRIGRPRFGWSLISFPISLQRLIIRGGQVYSSIPLHLGNLASLPNFKSLEAIGYSLTQAQLEQMPPSLTALSCSIGMVNLYRVPNYVSHAIASLHGDGQLLQSLNALSSEPSLLPNLTDLYASSHDVPALPPSLTVLRCFGVSAYSMPESLTALRCVKLIDRSSTETRPYPWFLPPKLRIIEFYPAGASFSHNKALLSLPTTLEECHIYSFTELELLNNLSKQGRLPNLVSLHLKDALPLASIHLIPSTLHELCIMLEPLTPFDLVPLAEFRDSSISKLHLSLVCRDEKVWTHLTDHWPRGLTDLYLSCRPHAPSANFTWPQRLQKLELVSDNAGVRLPPLPHSLHSLGVRNLKDAHLALDPALLPPFLSKFDLEGVEGNHNYFRTRKSPSSDYTGAPFSVDDLRYCGFPYR